ncbi:hypothetical protein [Tepidibacillus fermentans]|uniref:Uncharacterized protein n=1 Tax=Tepidibacillus fermentans TaxID=1281767 RepID=A0A4R3KDB6_9BACI|nr:hypothetical protein [Tepidibacillus fermentans]TCS81030.1 hypothetical protein EDD72_1147 [Tepidibacillus fermentans]
MIDIAQEILKKYYGYERFRTVYPNGATIFDLSYRPISSFIKQLPQRPVMAAFTATATLEVKKDIIRLLETQ